MNNEKIIQEANFYIESNKNLTEVAKELGISKSTLQLHIRELKNIDKELYNKIRTIQANNQIEGRKKGATIGKRTVTYTKEQANYIAAEIANKQLTYKEAEKIFDIPSSTIYEMVHSRLIEEEIRTKIELTAEANIHKTTLESYENEINNRNRPR